MDRVTDTVKPYSTTSPSFKGGNNENELNPELALKLKSPNNNNKKQLQHAKNFMSPTISAAIKANNNASVPKNKILTERNETLDVVEQNSVVRKSTSLGSKVVKFAGFDACDDDNVEKGLVGKSSLQPYDPVKNYLSPRPRFLRYNPNRRRKISSLRESREDFSFDLGDGNGNGELPSSGLELGSRSGSGLGLSGGFGDSCIKKESVEESVKETEKRGEAEDDERDDIEEEDEDMTEFGEDNCWGLKGILKFVFVVVAVILSTQAICSMNSPDSLRTKESLWGYSDWYSKVYGVAGSNVSEVVYGVMGEADLLVGRLKVGEAYHDHKGVDKVESTEELVEIQDELMDEVENDEATLSDQESAETMQWAEVLAVPEIAVSEVVDIGNLEAEKEVKEFSEDGLIEVQEINASEVLEVGNVEAEREVHDSDQEDRENNFQVTADADFEMEESMEEVMENAVVDDIKTSNALVKSTTFDTTLVALIGLLMLVLMFVGTIYRSKRTKPSSPASTEVAQQTIVAEKEEIKVLEPTPTPSSSLVQQVDDEEPLENPASVQEDVSKEASHATYAPSVELLGEFVFGEEVTSSVKNYNNISAEANASNSFIQTTTVTLDQTKSSHMEISTGDSHTVKKQRRKIAEVSSTVTPSSVRRSSRLQSRSIVSP